MGLGRLFFREFYIAQFQCLPFLQGDVEARRAGADRNVFGHFGNDFKFLRFVRRQCDGCEPENFERRLSVLDVCSGPLDIHILVALEGKGDRVSRTGFILSGGADRKLEIDRFYAFDRFAAGHFHDAVRQRDSRGRLLIFGRTPGGVISRPLDFKVLFLCHGHGGQTCQHCC